MKILKDIFYCSYQFFLFLLYLPFSFLFHFLLIIVISLARMAVGNFFLFVILFGFPLLLWIDVLCLPCDCLGLICKYVIEWVAYEPYKHIFHSS